MTREQETTSLVTMIALVLCAVVGLGGYSVGRASLDGLCIDKIGEGIVQIAECPADWFNSYKGFFQRPDGSIIQ